MVRTVTTHSFFGREGAEFGRGLGFLDAIYGFAITLLVANIDLPPSDAWRDASALLDSGIGTQLLGFLISFVVIALFWRNSTALLAGFRGIDGAVIAANLVLACLIVLIPFTTQAISDPQISDYPLATALYALNVALAIAAHGAVREIGWRRGLLPQLSAARGVWASRIDLLAQIGVFAVSIPVGFLAAAEWGQLCWALLIPVGLVTGRWSERVAAEDDHLPGARTAAGAPTESIRPDTATGPIDP